MRRSQNNTRWQRLTRGESMSEAHISLNGPRHWTTTGQEKGRWEGLAKGWLDCGWRRSQYIFTVMVDMCGPLCSSGQVGVHCSLPLSNCQTSSRYYTLSYFHLCFSWLIPASCLEKYAMYIWCTVRIICRGDVNYHWISRPGKGRTRQSCRLHLVYSYKTKQANAN